MAEPQKPSVDPRSVLTRPAPPPDGTVRYGRHPDQIADIRLPRPDAPGPGAPGSGAPGSGAPGSGLGAAGASGPLHGAPLVVVLHGGFWRTGYDRHHTGPLAADLAARGHVVAQLEYRRPGRPGTGWPATFDDVAAGIAALPALVAALAAQRAGADPAPATGLDPQPPVLLGHSAGGHLALWYAASTAHRLRGVLALAAVSDLAEAYRLNLDGDAVHALLGGGPTTVPDRYSAADPARLPAPRCRTVLLHGVHDRQVPIEFSRRYVAAANVAGADVDLVELQAEHFALIDPEAEIWPTVVASLRSVLG